MWPINKFMIELINKYQKSHTENTPKRCKYAPTCSQYSKECYQNYNFIYATFLTVYRILRCNPLSRGGYDPIPKIKKLERKMIVEKSIADIDKDNYLNRHFK